MTTLTRKQREIRDREGRILHVARQLMQDGGYLGLSMDAIASELEYSKGTIYNHFPCKEEIIIALAIGTMEKRTEMFQRAASKPGLPRERLTGVGVAAEMFVKLYPEHFGVEQLIRSASIREKTSEKRRMAMHACEDRCMGIVAGVVRDAVSQGHLELRGDMTPEDLVFGLWSQTFGAYSIIATSDALPEHGVRDPYLCVRQNINMMLDGFGWSPLSTDYDFLSLFERLQTEVFPDECRQVHV